MERDRISVIVPVYNVESFLARCIESIICQTYQNLEIILVDDGSDDGCSEICDSYAEKDARIRVVHKKNGGLSDARNIGIQFATGEYIGYVDSDDWIQETMYEKLYQSISKENADIAVCGYYISDGKNATTAFQSHDLVVFNKEAALEELCKNTRILSHAWDKLYKRSVLENKYFPKGKYYEDIYIMHKVFLEADKIVFLDEPLYYYFQRAGSIVSNKTLLSYEHLILGFKSRLEDLECNQEKLNSRQSILWTKSWIIRAIVDYSRIAAMQNIVSIPNWMQDLLSSCRNDSHVLQLIPQNSRFESKLLDYNIKVYFIFRKFVKTKNERIVEGLKNIAKIKNSIHKIIRPLKFTPFIPQKEEYNNCQKIILMGSPEYDNLGDHAIAYATKNFIQKNFAELVYLEISEGAISKNFSRVKKIVTERDILLLQGGGNFGDLYKDQEKIRIKVIEEFPNNTIIMMPQTVFYSRTEQGTVALQQFQNIMKTHQNVMLFAREYISYGLMKKWFGINRCLLVPDIVLSLNLPSEKKSRFGVGMILRSDIEGLLGIAEKKQIQKALSLRFKKIDEFDTCIGRQVLMTERKVELEKLWDKIASYELIVTDRLHGMIFAAITGTPCIAVSNNNHKIEGISEWLSSNKKMAFCKDIYNFDKILDQLLNITETGETYDFVNQFESLRKYIGGQIQ